MIVLFFINLLIEFCIYSFVDPSVFYDPQWKMDWVLDSFAFLIFFYFFEFGGFQAICRLIIVLILIRDW